MIPASYRPKKKFMQLAIAEAKRANDRGDYPIGAVITRLTNRREVVIASAGNPVKTSGSSIKHVELEILKYVSSGYGRGTCLSSYLLHSRTLHHVRRRLRVVQDWRGGLRKRGTEDYKWRACLIPCHLVFEKGNHDIPVIGGFLRRECQQLFTYSPS
jgi:tRNA(Arg) A34 adenosine deaminase TadA